MSKLSASSSGLVVMYKTIQTAAYHLIIRKNVSMSSVQVNAVLVEVAERNRVFAVCSAVVAAAAVVVVDAGVVAFVVWLICGGRRCGLVWWLDVAGCGLHFGSKMPMEFWWSTMSSLVGQTISHVELQSEDDGATLCGWIALLDRSTPQSHSPGTSSRPKSFSGNFFRTIVILRDLHRTLRNG
ncbi:hypothetical protein Tco_0451854 [Tanacetum coccineum]